MTSARLDVSSLVARWGGGIPRPGPPGGTDSPLPGTHRVPSRSVTAVAPLPSCRRSVADPGDGLVARRSSGETVREREIRILGRRRRMTELVTTPGSSVRSRSLDGWLPYLEWSVDLVPIDSRSTELRLMGSYDIGHGPVRTLLGHVIRAEVERELYRELVEAAHRAERLATLVELRPLDGGGPDGELGQRRVAAVRAWQRQSRRRPRPPS